MFGLVTVDSDNRVKMFTTSQLHKSVPNKRELLVLEVVCCSQYPD